MAADEPNIDLQHAMAEALASVERREAERITGRQKKRRLPESALASTNEPSPAAEAESARVGAEALSAEERLVRLAAEFENFRKRARREQEEAKRFGREPLLVDVLQVADNLERALQHAKNEQDPLVQGVRMVLKHFIDVLEGHGVRAIKTEGAAFDPEFHEAVGKTHSPSMAPGTVVAEHQKGYMLHDRLLRPARVVVAGGAESSAKERQGQ